MGKSMLARHMREREKEITKSLNVFPHRFSSILNYRKEFIHGHLSVILIESRKESSFQVNSRIDRVVGEASKPIKS